MAGKRLVRTGPTRLVGRLLIVLFFSIVAGVAVGSEAIATPALPAAPWDCKDAPIAAMPDSGLPGFFDPAPDPIPPQGDPFAATRSTTVYDQYGYAGLSWSTYDLGCGGAVRDIEATTDTFLGNFFFSGATWMASATNGIHNKVAHPDEYMAPLDVVVGTVTQRMHERIWSPWGMVAFLGVAALLLAYSLRGHLSSVMTAAAWALLVVAVLSGISQYPTRTASFFDETVTQSIASINQTSAGLTPSAGADPTRAQGALIVDDVLYQAWLRGQFGDPNSAAAQKWGPVLFRESTFSRTEAATASSTPDGIQKMTEQKANDWVTTTQEIQEQDPIAYAAVQGKSKGRAGAGFMAFIGVLFTGLFRLVADLFMFAGLVMLRLLVMFFPAAAVFGVLAPMASIVRRIGNIAGASVINVIAFGAGSAIHTVLIAAILFRADGAGMGVLSFVLCLVVTVAAFIMLMPLLSLTNVLGRPSSTQTLLRRAGRRVRRRHLRRGRHGEGDDDDDEEEDESEEDEDEEEAPRRRSGRRRRRSARRTRPPVEAFGRPATVPLSAPVSAGDPGVHTTDGRDAGHSLPAASRKSGVPVNAQGSADLRPPTESPAPSGGHGVHRPSTAETPHTRDRVVVGVLVDELPTEIRETPATRIHDSHTEVRPDGVGPRLYDPATKQTVLPEAHSRGVADE
ncbi:hypothetical protein [Intrasporangium calvum]|uniref:TrbL/VirB6 plasmid conjugal transfer protein n=1 Tax=Intrasporangium calvum (strain ATCC 23552 / DSM 43043 / JCM 3097 / NBRC 12989 / NCIMB 10167 / NRRL B-3866 / 7 KIP) TaxID=710696 RepID=E6SEJ0_INTC7|nr:hypothetical protein [Intrasporangium calvum]ADU46591.1 hypothetical protein Intca_0029 [Intrasporangium calvum DSM 43043]